MPRDYGSRPSRNWTFAADHKERFEEILPAEVCEAAMATCRFQIRGLRSNGNEWGIGFLTHMQTFGNEPNGTGINGPAVQRRNNFIELTSHEAASIVLDCFGLTAWQVLDFYGEPPVGERMLIDLYDVIAALRPEFGLLNDAARVA